jgi:hypothetical protein
MPTVSSAEMDMSSENLMPVMNDAYEEIDIQTNVEEDVSAEREAPRSMLQTLQRWRNSCPEELRHTFDVRSRPLVTFIKDNAKRRRTLDRTWADYNINTGSTSSQLRDEAFVESNDMYELPIDDM